jgi:hypothetical protein
MGLESRNGNMNRVRLLNKHRNKATLALYYGVRALALLAAAIYLARGDVPSAVYSALIFFLILVPGMLRDTYKVFLPFTLDLFLGIFVFLTVLLGSVSNFYERFEYWDTVLHFQSGLLLGVLGFSLVYTLNERVKERVSLDPGFISFFAVCFSALVSVVWEIYEYAGDSWFGSDMQESGLPDTMGDLILNLLGAVIVTSLGYAWMRRRGRVPFTPTKLSETGKAAVNAP